MELEVEAQLEVEVDVELEMEVEVEVNVQVDVDAEEEVVVEVKVEGRKEEGYILNSDEDYYKLLGVSKDASNREIRQAFKKLALTMHPDKNPNNQDAHDKFLKINRAYEVLKDEDLRKKYDKYGEKGLQDNQEGGRYESWNFYRYDFGIYDDDIEIITLDRADFDAAVNSGELWFVNFYFPRCSHCHDLAPTWREFAKEMDGLIRIGAVNCGDNRMLCRSKGINSYPSLYIFKLGKNPEKYYGDRSKKSLISFAMQFVTTQATELWTGNFVKAVETAFTSGTGWLITFCASTGDCLSSETRHKLAGMLDGLAHVGWIDCTSQGQLCESFDITTSMTAYFPPGASLQIKGGGLFFNSLDAKEIYSGVLEHLPGLETLTKNNFKDKLSHHRWLVHFTFGEKEEGTNEYKKLKMLLKDEQIQVGHVDCKEELDLCNSLYIHKPSIAVFKGTGVNNFEIHHGRNILYNIVAFAKDSISAHVITLGPQNFPNNEKKPWLVDFFAPWCPPCRALLPELRKASKQLYGQLNFGTIDCTIHEGLCNMDLVNPSVVALSPETFEALLSKKKDDNWVVDFYAPWCGPCQALMPEWKRMARMLSGVISVGSVDCQKYHTLCHEAGVKAYPEIRFYPQNSKEYQSLPRASVDLTPEDFNKKVLSGKEHWVVDFYAPWCGPCQHFAPEFELLARSVKQTIKAGKLDCQAYPHVCQSAGVRAYPSVRFFPYIGGTQKHPEGEHINSRESKAIADHLNQRLQQINPQIQDKSHVKFMRNPTQEKQVKKIWSSWLNLRILAGLHHLRLCGEGATGKDNANL
ncbi:DJC10 protein, partial [Polypterus senegalus]